MTLTHRLALAAMFAGAAAFAQTSSSSSSTATPSTTPPGATEAGKTAAHLTASGVLSMIHQVNQDEIRLAKTAQSKAQNDKVKDYAKDMIDDHTALDKKVSDFVQKEGKGKVTLSSSQIPAAKRQELKNMVDDAERQLSTASGPAFDQSYMSEMVRAHEAVLSDLEAALPSLKGQDKIHDLVSDARDKVKEHRDHAADIVKDLNRSTATGGSGTQGSTGSGSTGTTTTPTTPGTTSPSSGGTGR